MSTETTGQASPKTIVIFTLPIKRQWKKLLNLDSESYFRAPSE
jgi:hypothetical protein